MSTVSHVINKTRFVSPETTIAVQKVVDDLGFQPDYLTRALKSKRTQTIGMLVKSSTNPFFAEIVSGVEEEVTEVGIVSSLVILVNLPADSFLISIHSRGIGSMQ